MSKYEYEDFWISETDYITMLDRLASIKPGGRSKRTMKMDQFYDEKNDKYIYSYRISLNLLGHKKITSNVTVEYLLDEDKELCAKYNSASRSIKLVKFKVMD